VLASTDIEGNKLYLKVSGHVRKQKKKTLRRTENAHQRTGWLNLLRLLNSTSVKTDVCERFLSSEEFSFFVYGHDH
jgi:hypothetical protein